MSGYTINWAKGALPDPFGSFIEGRGEGLKQMLQYMQLLKAMRSLGGGGGGRSRGSGGRSRGGGSRSPSGRMPVRRVAPGTPTGGRENPFAPPSSAPTRGPEYSTSGRGDPRVAAPLPTVPGASFGLAPPGVVPTRSPASAPPVAYPAVDRNTPVAPVTRSVGPAAPAWQDDGTIEPVKPPRYFDMRGRPLPGPQGTAPPEQRSSLDDANIYGSLATDNIFGPDTSEAQMADLGDPNTDMFEFEPGDLAKMAEDMAAMTALQDQEQQRAEQEQYQADVEAIEQSMNDQQETYQDDPFEDPDPEPEPEDPFEDDGE